MELYAIFFFFFFYCIIDYLLWIVGEHMEKKIDNLKDYMARLSKLSYQAIREGRYKEAETNFLDVLSHDPSSNYGLVGLGDALRRQNRHKEAIKYYHDCLELYPENNYALFGIAESYRALKDYPSAIQAWERYAVIDTQNLTVMSRMADIYRKMKKLKQSKEMYERILNIEEENVYAIIGLAHVYYDMCLYDVALNYWEQVLSKPNVRVDFWLLTSIGNCHRKLRHFDQSLEFFQKAEQFEPKNFYVLYGIAKSYHGLQKFDKSMQYWNYMIEAGFSSKFILTCAGDTESASGNFSKARGFYQQALSIGEELYARLGLAKLEYNIGNYKEAQKILESLLHVHYRSARLQMDLAMNYCAMNEPHKALKNLKSYLQQGYGNEEIIVLHQSLEESLAKSHD